ncbi:N-acetylneuraminate synthase family protein [Marispirochaeta aestuarii]|uniref:N-acetylneuraminate synthase family protein n=1 Tax=Marispirochaeta aestuarii TaxID=1963862 RepID=UPI0029C9A6AC|nr:N-acetylneuraminate synthase family protein [Marispirochaeta aestuarii]
MIIAELGLNHQGNEAEVGKLLGAILSTPVDAVTVQVRETEYYKQPKNERFFLDDYVYKNIAHTILSKKKKFGVALSDQNKVDFFADLGTSFYKVLSKDINNYELLNKIALTGKEIYLSTGLSDLEEIHAAVDFLKRHEVEPVLNHTALNYSPDMINLNSITELKKHFNLQVSYGNHSPYFETLFTAIAYEPESIFIYVKGNLEDDYKDDSHALPVYELNHYLELFSVVRRSLGSGVKEKIQDSLKKKV